jgi:hypothetical protein
MAAVAQRPASGDEKLYVTRHAQPGSSTAFPQVSSPSGWTARASKYVPACKSCGPAVCEQLLRWLVLRAEGTKYRGELVTIPRIQGWLESEYGVAVRYDGIKDHIRKHTQMSFLDPKSKEHVAARREARTVAAAERTAAVREAVQARTGDQTVDHISYLQTVVGIAEAVVREFPERVTPEMGLRAAAELSRIKASAERDRMLELLAFASGGRAQRALPVVAVAAIEAAPS